MLWLKTEDLIYQVQVPFIINLFDLTQEDKPILFCRHSITPSTCFPQKA